MTSTIGCHSPEDQKILHEGHRVFVSSEAKLREMPGTPLEGSRLFGLDQEESLLISPSRTLQHSLLTAITGPSELSVGRGSSAGGDGRQRRAGPVAGSCRSCGCRGRRGA